jgi:integrase
MSLRNTKTTADYIPWENAINTVHRLYKDKNYTMSLFIACGIFTGLRVTDLRALHWNQLLNGGVLTITEHKTKKERQIKLNPEFVEHVKQCYEAMGIKNPNEHCFLSQKKTVISIQWFNRLLKDVKKKYKLPCKNISCHALRKTMGRAIFEKSEENSEMALIKLSEVFGHSNTQITRRYLGLKTEEILSAYDLLSF